VINATSELNYLYRGARALAGFRARAALAWLRHGHVLRRRAISAYTNSHPDGKLHLGASQLLDGWLNSQILGHVPIDVTRRLPLPDNSFVTIYSSHLVEHLHRLQFERFLAESLRVLKPGGQHIVATPSVEKIARTLYGPDSEAKTLLMEAGTRFYSEPFHSEAQQINLTMRAFGHRFLYDLAYMRAAGLAAGFASVECIDNFELPDPHLNSYVARKPQRWNAETETFVFRAPE
jgi:predicted SAM-dependent methyltransferase